MLSDCLGTDALIGVAFNGSSILTPSFRFTLLGPSTVLFPRGWNSLALFLSTHAFRVKTGVIALFQTDLVFAEFQYLSDIFYDVSPPRSKWLL